MLCFDCASTDLDSGFMNCVLRALKFPLRIALAIQQVRHEFRKGVADDSAEETDSDLNDTCRTVEGESGRHVFDTRMPRHAR